MNASKTRSMLLALLVAACTPRARAQVLIYELYGNHDEFGFSVGAAGDIDRDGYADFVSGNWPGFGVQRARVFCGRTGRILYDWTLPAASGNAVHVAAAGDVNGDGWPDVTVGDPSSDDIGSQNGRVLVFSGRDGVILHALYGDPGLWQQMGRFVENAGDVDADGRPDIVASFLVPGPNHMVASLRIWSGATGAVLHTILGGATPSEGFGHSPRGLGDVNQDGHDDVLASAIASNGSGLGHVRIFSGADASTLLEVQSGNADDYFGKALDTLGDIDADAIPDFAVGAPNADLNGTNSGAVFWFSGQSGALLRTSVGAAGRKLGRLLADVGDADGDGVPDLAAVDGPGFGQQRSTVHVYSGATGEILFQVRARFAAIGGEVAIDGAGDVNGDGLGDLVIGDPLAEDAPSLVANGSVHVHLSSCAVPQIYCAAKTNSQGCTPQIQFGGAPSLSIGDNFVVRASNVLPHANGLLFFGSTPNAAPFAGGTLCVSGPVLQRTAIQDSGGAPRATDCSGSYAFHFSHTVMAAYGFLPGQRYHAQFYSRDSGFAAPDNIGLTNAVAFTVCP